MAGSTDDRRRVPPPLHPRHPERVCWGCDKYCPADALACGNGSIRSPHPAELFGDDWLDWELDTSHDRASSPSGDRQPDDV
ncbi:MAG: DUF3079 domain-containing protein [Vicinamibacterales bacterium]